MFGYLAHPQDSKWTFFDYDRLKRLVEEGTEIQRDTSWHVQPAGTIDRIVKTGGLSDRWIKRFKR